MQKHNLTIFSLFLLVLCFLGLALYLYFLEFFFSAILCIVASVFVLYLIYDKTQRLFLSISQVVKAVAKEDISVKISNEKLPLEISEPLITILEKTKKYKESKESIKIIYEEIINSMDTGVLILKKDTERIFYSNQAFFEMLELPQYTKWHLVKEHLHAFEPYLKLENWDYVKDVVTLKINGREEVFSLRTYLTHIYDIPYLIVNLDTLQSIIERKEKEAWFNLMKVMSHEILNTIAPINSLTHNLEYLITDSKVALAEDYDDIYRSVVTIKKRTHHLIDFVDTYRVLAELPTPKLEKILVSQLFKDSALVLSTLLSEKKVVLKIEVVPDYLSIQADKNQIEQVLINLITNSVYALEGIESPCISLIASKTETINCLEITDNGAGISEDIKRDIFVPFFTTRENGSGIGLSLSKNIIQAHKGTIDFISVPEKTSFFIKLKTENY